MCRLIPASQDSPACCIPSNQSVMPITYSQLNNRLKCLIKKANIPGHFGTHSFRREGASWAARAGVTDSLIQLQGDWVSDCYKKYIEFPLQSRLSVSKSMCSLINNLKI